MPGGSVYCPTAAVSSVAINAHGSSILVGTRGSQIYEITNVLAVSEITKISLLTQGHFADELWAVAMHPTDPDIFVTAGDDHTLRVWSVSLRCMLRIRALDSMCRAIAFSPDGMHLALGLGGRVLKGKAKKAGAFQVLDFATLEEVHQARDSREFITDIRFSPDGKSLAVASFDNKIYLYDTTNSYMLRAKCEKHSSFVTHFDFSDNSAYIQSNCGAYELLFFNTNDGSEVLAPSALKDESWASQTCVLGWSVQGLWPELTNGVEINGSDRSHCGTYVASVDNRGHARMYNYPCLRRESVPIEGHAHASTVTAIRFSSDDKTVVTLGGNDRCVMTWKVQ
jgi:microtubule-associated protein-like 6